MGKFTDTMLRSGCLGTAAWIYSVCVLSSTCSAAFTVQIQALADINASDGDTEREKFGTCTGKRPEMHTHPPTHTHKLQSHPVEKQQPE